MHPHYTVDRKNENKKGRDIPVRPFFFYIKHFFFGRTVHLTNVLMPLVG